MTVNLNRSVEVLITAQGDDFFKATGNNSIVVTDLQVKFEIKKSLGKAPNPATVTIYNLASSSRSLLNHRPTYVTLRAGYDGTLRPLFQGNILNSPSNLNSPDWETKFQVKDGGRAYAYGFISRSYVAPVNPKQILLDVCASMNLSLPSAISSSPALRQALSTGFSAHGFSRDVLTRVLAPLGLNWSIQNGALQVLADGAHNANDPWRITVEDGLIGSPSASTPNKAGGKSELELKVQLYPEISPGDLIQVTSKAIDHGLFRVNDISHIGDTLGADWLTEIKAVPK